MQKIKSIITNWVESEKGKDILIVIIVILVGIFAFELGRLSKENGSNGVKIEYTGQQASAIDSISQSSSDTPKISLNPSISDKIMANSKGNYFASKKGKKYYSAGCSAGKTIKEENRIYFNTAKDAENAGYTLSSAC